MQLSRYAVFLVCFVALICVLLYQSELVPTISRSRVQVPDNHQIRSRSMMRWHRISDKTLVWHMTHYEHRDFPYGGPAIILMLFHYHKETLPSIALKVCSDDYCECLQPQWIQFGKVAAVRFEVDYLFYAVFTRQVSNTSILEFNTRSLYNSNCTGSPLIQDLSVYYETEEKQIEFAVCLYKGIIAKDTSLLDIASWIEINRAIGVEHITMYNQDIGPDIIKLLSSYQDEGFVSLIDWKIHNPEKRIANNGQVATANDCFYRYLRRAKYILFIDLDELIIPHAAVTLGDMMRSAPLNRSKSTEYLFYNSFWHETPDIALSESKAHGKLPIHFVRANRTKNPPSTIRYKYIARSETAVRIGIHHMYEMKKGQRFPVPARIGLMHHYRIPDYAISEEQITDNVMSRYFDSVMNQLTARLPDQASPNST